MLHRLFHLLSKEKVTKSSRPRRRRLAFETMESRELLSVSPLGMALQLPLLAPSDAIATATPQAQTLAAAQDSYCNNQLHCFAVEAINDEASEDGSKKLIFKVTLDKAKFPTSQVFTKDIRIITDDPGRFDIVTYMQLEDNEIDGFYDDNIYPVSTCVGYAGLNSYGYYFTDSGSYTHFVHDRDGDRIYAECMMIEITPINDAIPKEDYDFTLEIYNKYYYYSQTPPTPCGSASGTITGDDDDWTVSASINGDDDEALEPCTWIPGNQRTGAFEITREGGTDRNYEITVEFTLGGTATASAAGANPRDYHITKNPNGGDSNAMAKYDSSKGVWWTTMAANEDTLVLYVMPDGDHIFEDDETVTLTLVDAWGSLNGIGYYDVDGADGNVEILQAPEFLSDADKNNNPNDPIPINADSYNLPFQYGKPEDGMVVVDSLACAKNRPVVYSIVTGNDGGLYEINAATGKITFAQDAPANFASDTLQVKVADAAHPGLYDLATVTFTFGWAEFVMCVEEVEAPTGTQLGAFWGFDANNEITVGHTFWHIKTSSGLKNNLAVIPTNLRPFVDNSWGYYPAVPLSLGINGRLQDTRPGELRDDNGHATTVYKIYDIVSLANLTSVLVFTKNTQDTPGTYNLNSNNCTTVAIAAADAAGVSVPKNKDQGPIYAFGLHVYDFDGYSPRRLGYDLRNDGGTVGQFTP